MKNIKYFLATPLFIGVLLSGCNLVGGLLNYGNQSNSSAISENNQFAATNFPLESCGDTLPIDSHVYPIEVYSVTLKNNIRDMEGNRRNGEIIKSQFCSNFSVWGRHEQYEIASFINRDKAADFKQLIESELDNDIIQLSSPQIIEVPPSQITVFTTKEEIGAAAGLTESQIEQLVSLEEYRARISLRSEDTRIRKVKAIVPTYLPHGFKVDEFTINQWGDYRISYKNRHNACFRIYDTGLRGDAPAAHETVRAIYSHALGYVNLGYTETNRLSSDFTTGFDMVKVDATGSDLGYILGFDAGHGCNQQPSLQELIKVIQSLHLLNPPQTTKPPSTNNPFQSMSFPKDSCGDSLPEDPDAYPVEFYPVFIDYSESNLESVQSQFCRDSLKIYRKSLDEDYIQVASFVGQERANQFKTLIQSKFANVEIGEVSIIEAP
ncbi:hypothetical protein [Planktothrix agardhii]|jgi:hypothetical protein|uniref:hypothetical protein n=1 Tax=Planktothrix agardhii TaxID=1160 RepID=UPI001F3B9150|nr:hypothetical protein [Planktothrix agardhii]MCF3578552.1 hypothetical protein [Planktothrix agardhii 1812]MCF3583315.1 hypothetical protein [Planktothrix agardhii 1811]